MKISLKISLCGILTAAALITFMIESLFPPIILPGAKLGLSNIFILLTAIILGGRYAFISLALKTILGSVFSGNVSAIMYSLPSGAIALTVELVLLYLTKSSIIAISVCGSVINTTIQNLTFCLITDASEYLAYLPYLSIISILSGVLVGFTVYLIVKKLPADKLQIDTEDINQQIN